LIYEIKSYIKYFNRVPVAVPPGIIRPIRLEKEIKIEEAVKQDKNQGQADV
jgi:hypothetical protein